MKTLITLLLIFTTTLSFSQKTLHSEVAEHWYDESATESVKEEMKRNITIENESIIITSYGKNGTDIQKWVITNRIDANSEDNAMTVMPCYLASGSPGEYPATFTIYYDEAAVDYITCLIPRMFYDRLPEGAPVATKFLIK